MFYLCFNEMYLFVNSLTVDIYVGDLCGFLPLFYTDSFKRYFVCYNFPFSVLKCCFEAIKT